MKSLRTHILFNSTEHSPCLKANSRSCDQEILLYLWDMVCHSHFGGVMVIVLAIKRKVCGIKPSRGDGLLRVIKNRNTPSLGGEVKPSAPCRKIYGM
jgi:hypothetical protein